MARSGDKRIVISLNFHDSAVAVAFPFRRRITAIPDLIHFRVPIRHFHFIARIHIEIGAGDNSALRLGRLHDLLFMVHDNIAFSELVRCQAGISIAVVGACLVNLAYGRLKIVHVSFHDAEIRIVCGAVFPASVLPALSLFAHM